MSVEQVMPSDLPSTDACGPKRKMVDMVTKLS